jgi:hypothetical protein
MYRATLLLTSLSLFSMASAYAAPDPRHIANGIEIYEHGYCDQPYVVVTEDGTWVCVFTTSGEREGAKSQYIVCTRSTDRGRTWTAPLPIESPDGPEASWGMPLMTCFGRIYVFYSYNGDLIRTLPNGKKARADMLGWYCYRYSDDNGKSWSERYRLPVRETAADRGNDWGGEVQIFWGIGEPVTWKNHMWFGFTKLGKYMLDDGEGWFFHSDNILTERDVGKINWDLWPEGEYGLRAPRFGSVQEEQNLVPLDNGDLYCMYRTTMGYPVHAYSRDQGRTWTEPEAARYANGRVIRHPRACPRIWKTKNGKYLFWMHNHGGKDFSSRNPAWICGGIAKDGRIEWSQPEILLYGHDHSDHTGRFSYPDLIEEDGRYFVTTTQKTRASIHEVDPAFFEAVWNQGKVKKITREGLVLEIEKPKGEVDTPMLPDLDAGGFTLALWMTLDSFTPGQALLDSRDAAGKGLLLETAENNTLALALNDGNHAVTHICDAGMLHPGKNHHIGIVVDGGPNIITWVIDGVVCDGNGRRQYGWGRFPIEMGDVNSGGKLRIAPGLDGVIGSLRIHDRYLLNSELIANYLAVAPVGAEDVAKEIVFHVYAEGSGEANGPNAFTDILEARDAVREEIAKGLIRPVRIRMHGTFHLPEGLQLGPEDSGTAACPVLWEGDNAILTGAALVPGWEEGEGGVWSAPLPEGASTPQLFAENVRMENARIPDDGYFKLEKPVTGSEHSAFVYRAEDLDLEGVDFSGATVYLWPKHDWFSAELPIASIDTATRTITMEGKTGYPIEAGNRYYLRNLRAALDRKGECWFDMEARRVCLIPENPEAMSKTEFAVPAAWNVIHVAGKDTEHPAEHIHFNVFRAGIAAADAVRLENAAYCSVRGITIENGAKNGIAITGASRYIQVKDSVIRFHGLNGIELAGLSPGNPDLNHHHVIDNNEIHHCGRLVGHGAGVYISQSGHNRITHNEIHHMPRYGTTIKGVRYQVLKERVEGVTWENHWAYLHSRKNLLAYNHIHHTNLDSQDTGAMESWGPGRDNVYDHNLIRDTGNDVFNLQSGIYLDDASDYFTITNNIIYNVRGTGGDQCIFAKGVGNVIRNNILIVAPDNQSAIRSLFMADERCDYHVYERNIMVFEGEDGAIYDFNNWSEDRVTAADYNLFWKPSGDLKVHGPKGIGGPFENWRKLQGGRFDAHSITADPMFADLEKRDFRLKPASPVLDLGFEPIDAARIGRREKRR